MNRGIIVLLVVLLFFSCKKDLIIVEGCTDQMASNWNSTALYDDGSC